MFEKQLGSLHTGTEVREREEGDQERMVREREGKGKPISAHSTAWHPLSHRASSPSPRYIVAEWVSQEKRREESEKSWGSNLLGPSCRRL